MIRAYRTPKFIITSATRKGAEKLAGKEELSYLGIEHPLDEETRDRLGIKYETRIGVVKTRLGRTIAGTHLSLTGNSHLILLNNHPRPASKSTLYHEAEHTLQTSPRGNTPRRLIKSEVEVEARIYEKTGIPKHNRRTMIGLMDEVVGEFGIERKKAKKLILAELKNQKAPKQWIREFRTVPA